MGHFEQLLRNPDIKSTIVIPVRRSRAGGERESSQIIATVVASTSYAAIKRQAKSNI